MTPSVAPRMMGRLARQIVLLVGLLLCGLKTSAVSSTTTLLFDLPSGDASKTLKVFAAQAHREIMFPAEPVAGLKTNPVQGNFTPRDALDRMVANTGLIVVEDAKSGAMMIGPAARVELPAQSQSPQESKTSAPPKMKQKSPIAIIAGLIALALTPDHTFGQTPAEPNAAEKTDETVQLKEFIVSGNGNTGYGAMQSSTGRMGEGYSDIPQMVSAVTSEFLADAKISNSRDAYKYVPNVQNNLNLSAFGTIEIRGITTGSTYTDGFSDNAAYNFDVAFTDRIEVVKGPIASAFGRGNPAGFINYVTKTPTFTTGLETTFELGSGNDKTPAYRAVVDYNGLLSKDGLTAFRFVALNSYGSGTQDWSEYRRYGAMVAVEHRFKNGRGRFLMNSIWSVNRNPGTEGNASLVDGAVRQAIAAVYLSSGVTIPKYPLLPSDFAIGYQGIVMLENVARTTAILDYQLSDHLRLRQAASLENSSLSGNWVGYDAGNAFLDPAGTGTLLFSPRVNWELVKNHYLSYQADMLWEGETPSLKLKHTLLFGADETYGVNTNANEQVIPNPQPLYNWNSVNPNLVFPINLNQVGTENRSNNWSPYIQPREQLFNGLVTLTAAFRKTYAHNSIYNRATGTTTTTHTVSPLLPTYSVMVKPLKWLSLYALDAKFQSPATVSQLYGAGLPAGDPRSNLVLVAQPTTTLHEQGIKGDLLGGRFEFTVAHFTVVSSGARLSTTFVEVNPNGSTILINGGFLSNQNSQGIEFEGFGQITNKLTFMFGGNFSQTSQLQPVGTAIYKVGLANNINAVYGYATYSFGKNRREGLSITGGWKTLLSGWTIVAAGVPAFGASTYPNDVTTVDLGAHYAFGRYTISLQGNNLFHPHSVVAGLQAVTSGRQVWATIEAHF